MKPKTTTRLVYEAGMQIIADKDARGTLNPVATDAEIADTLRMPRMQVAFEFGRNGIKQIFKNGGRRGEFKGGVGVQDGSKPANTLIATYGKLQRQATYIRERFYRQAVGTAVADNAAVGDTIDAFNRRTNKSGIAPTVTTRPDGFKTAILPIDDHNRIRKLTPKECFRLMGVSDDYADKMIATLSRTQCYKLAGNSIVVDVLAAIFEQLFVCNKNKNQQTEIFN